MSEPRITVVIPAYRVEQEITGVLDAMPAAIERIIVVDDASPDRLSERVRARQEPRITVLRHERNLGVGGATVTGMLHALADGCDVVVKCDGDGQMDPAAIPQLVAPVLDGCADHAKGCRFHHFQDLRSMPPLRLVGNIGLTFLTKLACGYWNVLDPVNGFFACRADVLRRIPLQGLSRGYFFETDLLIRLNIVQARVIDVALPARYGSQASSLSPARSLLMFPARLATGLLRRLFWRYLFYDVSPVAIFALLGGALASFGGVFGAYHWVKNSWAGVATPLGTIMVATLPLIVGIQLMLEAVVLDVQNTPRPDRREGAPISRR